MKRVLLSLLLVIIPSALLGGCGTLSLNGGSVRDGMPVVNSTRYDLVIYRNGDPWTGMLPPGGDAKIPTTNWSSNTNGSNNGISVYAKAYESGRFVGTAEHAMIYVATYDTYRVPWVVTDNDVRRSDGRR